MKPKNLTKEQLASLRDKLPKPGQFSDLDEAAALLERVRVMGTWSSISSLPSLANTVTRAKEAERVVWDVINKLPTTKRAHYAKILEGKGTLIALSLLPAFVAVSGDLSIKDRYNAGRLSADAQQVATYLAKHGPTAVDDLRVGAGYAGKENGKAFEKALLDLQQSFLISQAGQKPGNGNFMITIWDLTDRWYTSGELRGPDEAKALAEVICALVHSGRIVLESEIKKWLKPYPVTPQVAIDRLIAQGDLKLYAMVGKDRVLCPSA